MTRHSRNNFLNAIVDISGKIKTDRTKSRTVYMRHVEMRIRNGAMGEGVGILDIIIELMFFVFKKISKRRRY